MSQMPLTLLARRISLIVGLLDLATGMGLVWRPELTLALMGVTVPGTEALVQVRLVGAFVTGVGGCYLLALLQGRPSALRVMLAQTLLLRGAAGSYVAVACARGWLEPAWVTVAVTDLGLVVIQTVLLRQGVGREE